MLQGRSRRDTATKIDQIISVFVCVSVDQRNDQHQKLEKAEAVNSYSAAAI